VLAHDRSDLNPELLEQMRREILEVVQKYVEIDLEEGDVSLETGDRVTALVANLPIRRARPLVPQSNADATLAASPGPEGTAAVGAGESWASGPAAPGLSSAEDSDPVEASPIP
jgi:cell division topological specificity factor